MTTFGTIAVAAPASDANGTLMRRFVDEVINGGDYAAMRDPVHVNYVVRSPEQELHGRDALEALFRTYRSGLRIFTHPSTTWSSRATVPGWPSL